MNERKSSLLPFTTRIWVQWSRVLAWPCLLGLLISGCIKDFGTGGTGELVIPRSQLREIKTTDLPAAVPMPTTQEAAALPTTRPATRPVAQIEVTIEQVRRLALQNNLDLKVDLLDPTIAR